MCQKMSSPHRQSMANLGRIVRRLKRETQLGEAFSNGRMAEEVTTFTDSDWTGCTETRKSSSAAVILLGNHALKAYTRKQKTIAKSSAEAELCAAAWGGVRVKKHCVAVERSGLRDEASAGHRYKSHRTHPAPTRNGKTQAH